MNARRRAVLFVPLATLLVVFLLRPWLEGWHDEGLDGAHLHADMKRMVADDGVSRRPVPTLRASSVVPQVQTRSPPQDEATPPAAKRDPDPRAVAEDRPTLSNAPERTADDSGARMPICPKTTKRRPRVTVRSFRKVEAVIGQALRSSERDVIRDEMSRVCSWDHPPIRVGKGWPDGERVRALGVMSELDCRPQQGILRTAVHDSASERTPFDGLDLPLPADDGAVSMNRVTQFSRNSTYAKRARVVELGNVAMTCNESRAFFMTPGKRCYHSVWAVGTRLPRLATVKTAGRQKIFHDREGAFQFGGNTKSIKDCLTLSGTTILAPSFSNTNVGHCLHDAAWSFVAMLLAREHMDWPKPHRVMVARDFWENNCRYYADLVFMVMQHEFSKASAPMKVDADAFRRNVVVDPTYGGEEPAVCFEKLVVGGSDRERVGLETPESDRLLVAKNLRLAACNFLGLLQPPPVSALRVFVYGRNDVHRRSIDNSGQLLSAVADVLKINGLPRPTLVSTFTMSPAAQIRMASQMDILVTVSGAHIQNSLFMPEDAVVIEICPCESRTVSYLFRFGMFTSKQKHWLVELCRPMINLSNKDRMSQNLTMCPEHLSQVQDLLHTEIKAMRESRSNR